MSKKDGQSIIFKDDKVTIPKVLVSCMLQEIHSADHCVIQSSLNRARQILYGKHVSASI